MERTGINVYQNKNIPSKFLILIILSAFLSDVTNAYVPEDFMNALRRHQARSYPNVQATTSNRNLAETTNLRSGDKGPCNNQKLDLIFLLDGSKSVGERNFRKVLNFTAHMASKFDIGADKTRIGVVQYSSCIRPYIFLKDQFTNHKQLRDAIMRIKYDAKGTATGRALRFTATKMFTLKKGGRSLATGVRRVVIMVTDGQWVSKSDVISATKLLEEKSVERFAIGIGKTVKTVDLGIIASPPTNLHQYYIQNFDQLIQTGEKFMKIICVQNETCVTGNLDHQEFKGFDLLKLMKTEGTPSTTYNNNQELIYGVGPYSDLNIKPTSRVFESKFPTNFAIVATFRMFDDTSSLDWKLFEIQRPLVGAIFSLRIKGSREREIEYLIQDKNGKTKTFTFKGVNKLFESGFHKLVLYVSPSHAHLTLDCVLIGQIEHSTPPSLIDTSGKIIMAKNYIEDTVILDFKELLIICGAKYDYDSQKFNCCNTNQQCGSGQVKPTREAKQIRQTEAATLLPNLNNNNINTGRDIGVRPSIIHSNGGVNPMPTESVKIRPTNPSFNGGVIPNFKGLERKQCEPGPRGFAGLRGPKGHHGDNGLTGYEGKQGPQGIRGVVGGEGMRGSQGNRGPPGEHGYRGYKGDQGPKGITGPPGVPGANGERGVTGSPGYIGSRGNQGAAGQKGEEGGIGPKGSKGSMGLRGVAGVSGGKNGRPGRKGEIGLQGKIGEFGEKGDRGPKGYLGQHGQPGQQGKLGERGMEGKKGKKGDIGPMGPPGARGNIGNAGWIGNKGDQGSKGAIGPRGHQGEIGKKGSIGGPGFQGHPGMHGSPGPKGHEGIQGEMGKQGEQGVQGTPGRQGIKGAKGEIGDIGLRGEKGNQGQQGNVGVIGVAGPKGNKGEEGPWGPKGHIGPVGGRGNPGGRGPPRSLKEIEDLVKEKLAEMLPLYMESVREECQKCSTIRGYHVPGPPGPIGPKGDTGLPGYHGEVGIKGSQGLMGAKGDTGLAGPRGNKGDIGPRGHSISGQQGAVGLPGRKGSKGTSKHGKDGTKGGQGVEGSRGKMGVQGRRGRPGICDATICNPRGSPAYQQYPHGFSPDNKGPGFFPPPDGARERESFEAESRSNGRRSSLYYNRRNE